MTHGNTAFIFIRPCRTFVFVISWNLRLLISAESAGPWF